MKILFLSLIISSLLGLTSYSLDTQTVHETLPEIKQASTIEPLAKPELKEKKLAVPKTAPKPKVQETQPSAPIEPVRTGVEQWRPLVSKYFGAETNLALRVMSCESGGNKNAASPTNDHGLMQINYPSHYDKVNSLSELYNPEINIKVAKQIRDGSGWGAWVCFSKI